MGRPYITQRMRREVAERLGCGDGERIRTHCPYCDELIEVDRTEPKRVRLRTADGYYEPEMDHMESLHDGGSHNADNLVPACLRCNRSKGKRSLLASFSQAEAKQKQCFGQSLSSPESRAQNPDDRGRATDHSVVSPSPNRTNLEVWLELRSGLDGLSLNDHGRPWPYPNRAAIARLTAEFDPDLCLKAAREAKEIVQSQDRAPNVTGLFEKKCADLAGERQSRQSVRDEIRRALS